MQRLKSKVSKIEQRLQPKSKENRKITHEDRVQAIQSWLNADQEGLKASRPELVRWLQENRQDSWGENLRDRKTIR
jgi:hypothetical protein